MKKNLVIILVVVILIIAIVVVNNYRSSQTADLIASTTTIVRSTITPSIIPTATIDQSYLDQAPVTLKKESATKSIAPKKTPTHKPNPTIKPIVTRKPSSTIKPIVTPIAKIRITTGVGKTLSFKAGDTVVGWSIVVDNKTFTGGVVLKNSKYIGTVTDGVINPWAGEITNQKVIHP